MLRPNINPPTLIYALVFFFLPGQILPSISANGSAPNCVHIHSACDHVQPGSVHTHSHSNHTHSAAVHTRLDSATSHSTTSQNSPSLQSRGATVSNSTPLHHFHHHLHFFQNPQN